MHACTHTHTHTHAHSLQIHALLAMSFTHTCTFTTNTCITGNEFVEWEQKQQQISIQKKRVFIFDLREWRRMPDRERKRAPDHRSLPWAVFIHAKAVVQTTEQPLKWFILADIFFWCVCVWITTETESWSQSICVNLERQRKKTTTVSMFLFFVFSKRSRR